MAYPGSRGCRGHSGPASSGWYINIGYRGCVSHNGAVTAKTNDTLSSTYSNGYYCPANQYLNGSNVDGTVNYSPDEVVTVVEHNALKNAIIGEIQRRRQASTNHGIYLQGVTSGDIINNERLIALRDGLVSLAGAWSFPSQIQNANLEDGDYIRADQYTALKDRLNQIANDCVCNCNYCTCNCNYCTCNCNYSCTCNCNYSDLELKYDIEYVA